MSKGNHVHPTIAALGFPVSDAAVPVWLGDIHRVSSMSHRESARVLGVKERNMFYWLAGRKVPGIGTLWKLRRLASAKLDGAV